MKYLFVIGILFFIGCQPRVRECRSAKMELSRALENYLDCCGSVGSAVVDSIPPADSVVADTSFNWHEFHQSELKTIPGLNSRRRNLFLSRPKKQF